MAALLVACATPKTHRPRVKRALSAPASARRPTAAALASGERIDVCAGALIGLRGMAESLREEVASTRARGLVWSGERGSYFGKTTHRVDWNPALDHLSAVLDDVDGWISRALALAAAAHAAPTTAREDELERALERSGQALRVVAVYLAGIRSAQYALHEAPAWVVGGLGFNDGLVGRLDLLYGRLEALRATAEVRRLLPEIDRDTGETTAYIEAYFEGLQDGGKLMEAAHVVSIITGAVGMTQALAATARLLAGAAVESGGLTLSLAGAAGSAAGAAATEASIQGILKGLAVTTAGGTLAFRTSGGVGPVNAGLNAELRVGFSGPKQKIPSVTGYAKFRVPDRVTELTIEEVKNVLRVSRTRQIDDYLQYCKQTGRTLVLWVRPTTKVAKTLKRYMSEGTLRLEFIP